MSSYIHFTEDEKRRAREADIASFLMSRGENVRRSGSEHEWAGHHVTLRGGMWFDQYTQEGGTAVDFVMREYDASFAEAVRALIGGSAGSESQTDRKPLRGKQSTDNAALQVSDPPKPFVLPEAHTDMKRVFAYLVKTRGIDADIVSYFAKQKLLYEESGRHNAVFVGVDENGAPRHAHKRSTLTNAEGNVRWNVQGSEAEYAFHYIGESKYIFAVEAPIDLLSFICLHKDDWQNHSYVSLCSVSGKALLWVLRTYPHLKVPILGLDNDAAGLAATCRLTKELHGLGYDGASAKPPVKKDWNEDLFVTKQTMRATPERGFGATAYQETSARMEGESAWAISQA